jgi:hypothetical protein
VQRLGCCKVRHFSGVRHSVVGYVMLWQCRQNAAKHSHDCCNFGIRGWHVIVVRLKHVMKLDESLFGSSVYLVVLERFYCARRWDALPVGMDFYPILATYSLIIQDNLSL